MGTTRTKSERKTAWCNPAAKVYCHISLHRALNSTTLSTNCANQTLVSSNIALFSLVGRLPSITRRFKNQFPSIKVLDCMNKNEWIMLRIVKWQAKLSLVDISLLPRFNLICAPQMEWFLGYSDHLRINPICCRLLKNVMQQSKLPVGFAFN